MDDGSDAERKPRRLPQHAKPKAQISQEIFHSPNNSIASDGKRDRSSAHRVAKHQGAAIFNRRFSWVGDYKSPFLEALLVSLTCP